MRLNRSQQRELGEFRGRGTKEGPARLISAPLDGCSRLLASATMCMCRGVLLILLLFAAVVKPQSATFTYHAGPATFARGGPHSYLGAPRDSLHVRLGSRVTGGAVSSARGLAWRRAALRTLARPSHAQHPPRV